jgi:riboflavin kinase/FMN adenylyltransferase
MVEHKGAFSYKNDRSSVVTIGTFDGVHIGHAEILKRLVASSEKDNLDSVLLTFFPHPRMVLQENSDLKLINTLSEKKQRLQEIGINHLVIHPFTKEFSRLTAVEYVRDILVNQLKAKKVIIGYDHRFGRNRTANITDLIEFGKTYDFEVEEISAQELNEVAVSSTKIRKALEAGAIETANTFLGYAFTISGKVVTGKALGRTMDYPTANLKPTETYKLVPRNGVYLTEAIIDGTLVKGITSIGTNPTVGGTEKTIETYFLDFEKDIYGEKLQLRFITHIRDEETFKDLADLKTAIQKDEAFARTYLKTHE